MSATPTLCLPPLVPCIFRTDEHAPLVPAAIAWISRTLAVLPPVAAAHAKKYLLDPTRYPDAFGDLYKFFHKTEHAFSGLKETNSHYLRATTILALMCWGAAQPWGKGCQLESVLLHWRYSVESNPQEHNASAAGLLADFLPALDAAAGFFEPARRTGLRLRVYSYIERLMPWSNFSSFRKAMMHPVAIAMSSVAERHADKLDARWRNSLETATASMDEKEQQAWFLAMVESALRKSTKLSLAKMLPAEFWLDDFTPLTMCTLLAANEDDRFDELPWKRVAAVNQRLCAMYCPGMFEHARNARPDFDWQYPRQKKRSLGVCPAAQPIELPLHF